MTDPIADMLTRIRNAQAVKKPEVRVPASNIKWAIAKILEGEGYLGGVQKEGGEIVALLKYEHKEPKIRTITRVSKPGRRIYKKSFELPRVLQDYGIAIVSTSQGLMTNKEARKRKLGGEVLCEIY